MKPADARGPFPWDRLAMVVTGVVLIAIGVYFAMSRSL